MPVKPMLDGLELQLVQNIEVDGDQVLVQHAVPALEGDFLQRLGRRGARVSLTGVLSGPEAADGLKALREKFRLAHPVPFVADIATATHVDQVLIEEMGVRELAGKPERFEYAFTLREFTPPPPVPEEPPPPPPPPPPPVDTGTLEVEVIVEGQPGFDFSTVTVTVDGVQDSGPQLSRTLTNRTGNLWTEQDMPPGQYTARAEVTNPQPMSGTASGQVRAGQTTRLTIILRPDNPETIANKFVVHFWFDRAFIEPCLREVLREVAQRANNGSEKLLIVGHTDLTGTDDYNQGLSERRARSAFAYLTFGLDPAGSIAEWDRLRRGRVSGSQGLLNDNWGAREYQHILQDLGFYRGNITEVHDTETDTAVRAFQAAKGLAVDGVVGDDTWGALIRAYMEQDNLSVPPDKFLLNAKDGCNGGILKWLGCGEKDPVRNTQDAWRPNRRTELLFVNVATLSCDIPKPVTFDLPTPGSVGSTWCLGGTSGNRCCFAVPAEQEQCPDGDPRLCRRPADPRKIKVKGSIKFEDGTPLAGAEFVLIAPDGEFLHTDNAGNPDLAERPSGAQRGRPIPDLTDANGEFSYPRETLVGTYILEVRRPLVARLKGEPIEAAKGNIVCKKLDGSSDFDVIVVSPAVLSVRPSITLASPVVVVKKPHTNPVRQAVTLRVDSAFTGSGTFTRSSDSVRFFTAAVGGAELAFDGVDNVFTDAQLVAGVTLFAEGARASAALDDVELRLALTVGGQPGLSATARMTSVELTLDIALSRVAPGVDPTPLSENDKINVGRFLQARPANNVYERAMLFVRQAQPAAFNGDLELVPINAQVQAFNEADEVPAPGQAPVANPLVIPNNTIPANGLRFWAEGLALSNAARDTGFTLGIRNLERDGDRVAITVFSLSLTNNVAPFNTVIDRVQIEGILNRELVPNGGAFALADLFGNQADSLFRARLDAPGIAGNLVGALLQGSPPAFGAAGPPDDQVNIGLNRTAGDQFVSRPLLAVPRAIPRNEITTTDLDVVRARAERTIRVELTLVPNGRGFAEAPVRGRVVQIFASAITGSGVSEARIRSEIQLADRVWAQAGIEVRERGVNAALADPGNVLDLDGFDIAPFTGVLTAEEQTLLGSNRSAVNSDVNVYYVRSIDNGVLGEGISSDDFPAVVDPNDSGIILDDSTIDNSMAHELGHLLIHNGDEHVDGAGVQRPNTNIMHPFDDPHRRDLDDGQVLRAIRAGNPFVTILGG